MPSLSRKNRRQCAFTIVEVMFCLIIIMMMIAIFGAVFPFSFTASRFSNNYAQAALIAQHKIDELRETAWNNLDPTDLANQGVVDAGSCSSSGSATTCAFTATDNIADAGANTGYYPAGSTATLTIWPDTGTGVPANSVDNVSVTITWSGGGVPAGHYTAAAKLVETPHQ